MLGKGQKFIKISNESFDNRNLYSIQCCIAVLMILFVIAVVVSKLLKPAVPVLELS